MKLAKRIGEEDREITFGVEVEFAHYYSGDGCMVECPDCYGDGGEEVGVHECEHCSGTGTEQTWETCNRCGGDGVEAAPLNGILGDYNTEEGRNLYIPCKVCDGEGGFEVAQNCRECNGSGEVTDYEECATCHGEGQVVEADEMAEAMNRLESLGDVVGDGSVEAQDRTDTGEFVSAVYNDLVDFKNDMDTADACFYELKADSGEYYTAGLHVHTSLSGVNGGYIPFWVCENLATLWSLGLEHYFIDFFHNGEIPGTRAQYCNTWASKYAAYETYESTSEFMAGITNTEKLGNLLSEIVGNMDAASNNGDSRRRLAPEQTRYLTLNLAAYGQHGTVEFRLFDGTTHAYEIVEATRWATALFELAIDLGKHWAANYLDGLYDIKDEVDELPVEEQSDHLYELLTEESDDLIQMFEDVLRRRAYQLENAENNN